MLKISIMIFNIDRFGSNPGNFRFGLEPIIDPTRIHTFLFHPRKAPDSIFLDLDLDLSLHPTPLRDQKEKIKEEKSAEKDGELRFGGVAGAEDPAGETGARVRCLRRP